jgi:hypothetical protein
MQGYNDEYEDAHRLYLHAYKSLDKLCESCKTKSCIAGTWKETPCYDAGNIAYNAASGWNIWGGWRDIYPEIGRLSRMYLDDGLPPSADISECEPAKRKVFDKYMRKEECTEQNSALYEAKKVQALKDEQMTRDNCGLLRIVGRSTENPSVTTVKYFIEPTEIPEDNYEYTYESTLLPMKEVEKNVIQDTFRTAFNMFKLDDKKIVVTEYNHPEFVSLTETDADELLSVHSYWEAKCRHS